MVRNSRVEVRSPFNSSRSFLTISSVLIVGGVGVGSGFAGVKLQVERERWIGGPHNLLKALDMRLSLGRWLFFKSIFCYLNISGTSPVGVEIGRRITPPTETSNARMR